MKQGNLAGKNISRYLSGLVAEGWIKIEGTSRFIEYKLAMPTQTERLVNSDSGLKIDKGDSWKKLSDEDKVTVARARRIQRFLSQPMFVAEVFTGRPGKYVPIAETVRGFKEILEGKHDALPEQAFYMVGTIDEAVEAAKKLGGAG